MSVTGKVENGVVILPIGADLPEGAQVSVQVISVEDPLKAAIEKLAKPREHLPTNYALNHGRYIGCSVSLRSQVESALEEIDHAKAILQRRAAENDVLRNENAILRTQLEARLRLKLTI